MAWAAEEVTIDAVNFPDEIFREYVASKFDKDNNGKLSEKEITETTFIDIDNKGISSLKGVEYFTALTRLYFEDNQLTKLDVSKNTNLTHLYCSRNRLESLDISNNTALTDLHFDGNQLVNLDISNNKGLTYLYCSGNKLESLDVSKNVALTELNCSRNQLVNLDVSNNTALTHLSAEDNGLKTLDVRNNIALEWLLCSRNQLESLDVSKNTALVSLHFDGNGLESLDVSNNISLVNLYFSGNNITELKLNSQTYNTLFLYKGCLHSQNTNISDLQNVTETKIDDSYKVSLIKVTDITKPATYKADGKDFTIIYVDTVTLPDPGTAVPSDTHIFSDYNYTNPVTDSSIVIYGNGTTQTVSGRKVNNRIATVYTDILASYKYTVNDKGVVKPSAGKVIVGITKSPVKPGVNSKNKITDTSASKIAKAKIKNGQITVTALGKEGGIVYLWVIDTGNKGISAYCPVDVKLVPRKLEVQDTSGSKLDNPKLGNDKALDVCLTGTAGTVKAGDGTYTASVGSKYSSYVTVTPAEGSKNKFTIKATGLKNDKDTKAVIIFKCNENGKKIKFSLTITK